tara:strand:+ start:1791 stop:2453 length:663 start_codon:yes stop_codon:yes gene_type:complete
MHFSVKNLIDLQEEVNKKIDDLKISNYRPNIIAVSKTFPIEKIKPLIEYGHTHFGENKVQEAVEKWTNEKEKNPDICLHMIGKLQTNKVKFAVKLFDYIHSVDSIKLAKKIAEEQNKLNKKVKLFIQVNLNNEDQKSGISIDLVNSLLESCIEHKLDVLGLMCLPPIDKPPGEFFLTLKRINEELKLNSLSMGMSNDYLEAINYNSDFLRIGSKIFGPRG